MFPRLLLHSNNLSPCFLHSSGCALIHVDFQNNIEETANSDRKLQLYHFIFPFYSFPFCPGSVLTSQGFLANQLKSKLKQMNMIMGIQPTRITLLENLFKQTCSLIPATDKTVGKSLMFESKM